MEPLMQDLRYALRTLAKTPAFTAVAVLTLALGIGANTAIFSAVNAVLLRPLPYPDSKQLVEIVSTGFQGVRLGVSYPDLRDLRDLRHDFIGVAAYSTQRYNLSARGEPREVQASFATANLFDVLGVQPELGTGFSALQEREPLAVLGHALWTTSFGRDPNILGKSVSLDGKSYTVVGVMPSGFQFPNEDVQLWTTIGGLLAQDPQAETNRGFHFFNAVARLATEASLARVRGDLDVLARRLAPSGGRPTEVVGRAVGPPGPPPGGQSGAGSNRSLLDNGFVVSSLRDRAVGDAQRTLFTLLGAVGLVLLIACANAANLLLARATARRREMAIRQAIGAGQGRLVRQLLTESVLLAFAAGGVGVALSGWGLDLLFAIWPRVLPRSAEIGLDGSVLAFALALAALTGIAFGLVPAWRASRSSFDDALRDDAASTIGGRQRRRMQGGLVVGEIALALVLLVAAGLLVKSLVRLNQVDPGFDTRDVLAARVRLTPSRFQSGAQQAEFFRSVMAALSARPGVASATLTGVLPLSGSLQMIAFDPRTVRPDHPDQVLIVRTSTVSPSYFATLRISIKRGRAFTEEDRAGAPRTAVVNQQLVRQLWPTGDPIGKQIPATGPRDTGGPFTVVGIIDDLRSGSLDQAEVRPEMYISTLQQDRMAQMWIAVRASDGAPLRLAGAIRDAVRQADAEQPIGEIVSLEQLIGRQTAARRFNATLLSLFAALAVGLALIGVYGVTSYAVTQRVRELGIRMALGARPADVLRLLLAESIRRVALGVGLGLVIALASTRVLSSMLFGVRASDAATFAGTTLLLSVVAVLATYVPARRATRVDPMVALRSE